MNSELGYVVLEVGGIQNFILGTGKLKEMLGGSELVESLSKDFFTGCCESLGLRLIEPKDARRPEAGEVLALQRNAGALHLLFPSPEAGREFVCVYGLKTLECYPGLPLFAALRPCLWTRESIKNTKRELAGDITRQRNAAPVAAGMPMLPLCRPARLDGLPAVAEDGKEAVSLPSQTRRLPELLQNARQRLRKIELDDIPENCRPEWSEDLEELAAGQGKVAFIHMDGNDLGKLFRARLEKIDKEGGSPEKSIQDMGQLSRLVEETTAAAFRAALQRVLEYDLTCGATQKTGDAPAPRALVVPVRPLVLGGDDVTAVARADVALLFIDSFVQAFEGFSREKGTRLSVGVGMVVCPVGYPFLRAFALAEALIKNAKNLTADMPGERPSSMDYLVITNEVDAELETGRQRTAQADDGAWLTAKPLLLRPGALADFVGEGIDVLTSLPRSAVRPAMNECRRGKAHADKIWRQLLKNLQRGLGGRHNATLMSTERFQTLFPDGSFFFLREDRHVTRLGDYLELAHLLPAKPASYTKYLQNNKEETHA